MGHIEEVGDESLAEKEEGDLHRGWEVNEPYEGGGGGQAGPRRRMTL